MLSHERQGELLRRMRLRGGGSVVELADAVGVSASTIRRDLEELDTQGLLTRVHGGAKLVGDGVEVAPMARQTEHAEEKRRIGEAALAMVEDNSTILISGGTTTEALLPHLSQRTGLTVLTNSLTVAHRLSAQSAITVVVLGGVLRHEEMSLLGSLAERAIEDFHVDRAFIGVYGIDPELGLTGAVVHETNTDRVLMRAAPELVVLADSSKFGQRGPVRLAPVERIGALITDTGAPEASVSRLINAGINVQVV